MMEYDVMIISSHKFMLPPDSILWFSFGANQLRSTKIWMAEQDYLDILNWPTK